MSERDNGDWKDRPGFPMPEPIAPPPERPPHPYWQPQIPLDPREWRRLRRRETLRRCRARLKQIGALMVLTLFVYLAAALMIMVVLIPDVIAGIDATGLTTVLFIITPTPIALVLLAGAAVKIYFLLVAATILLSFTVVLVKSRSTLVREIAAGERGRHGVMLTIGGLFFAVWIINVIYYLGLASLGTEPSAPPFDDWLERYGLWYLVFIFAEASVWEEVVSRVLLIGVPLLWIDLVFRRDSLLSPERYFLGGKFSLGRVEVGLVLFSAIMFGLAHVGGWDLFKLFPTVIAGLAFGYLYLRIGFYAAVTYHFAFNFLSLPIDYFEAEFAISLLIAIMLLAWLCAGAMFLVYYIMRLGRFVSEELFHFRPKERRSEGGV